MKLIIILMIIVVGLVLWLIHDYKRQQKHPKLLRQYRAQGLSDQDIAVFRQTMNEAKIQIKKWENVVKTDDTLQLIEGVTGGLKSAKKLFQLIVKNPQTALGNHEFLYKQLPTMVELIATYEDLSSVDKLDQSLLTESQAVIRNLSEKIAKHYELELTDNLEKIKDEVENG
ncbi:MAG: 5-bromo-4-chloroindolyl phosphate hydrolysis family protein [Streptococcaceae bacterium]|jgi:5-bromo-4-chloroindolyl phosphate hydrolysis protein|nr:5-bromo-4-chloroindolyl phosphate hydrolysis family protein [Streptococcaceae bacterium]